MDNAIRGRRNPAFHKMQRNLINYHEKPRVSPRRLWMQRIIAFSTTALVVILILLLSVVIAQYRTYARLVDERLALGYLTSRAGIYAAPRVLVPGAPMAPERLLECLREADYVSDTTGNIWNGSFTTEAGSVKIKPRRDAAPQGADEQFKEVRISFNNGRISSITGDAQPLTSYALEPELLTKDARLKTDARRALNFKDLPSHLVTAILAIEDRRFFEHDGVDARGVARAF
jgi:penicillin-binding protein 1B